MTRNENNTTNNENDEDDVTELQWNEPWTDQQQTDGQQTDDQKAQCVHYLLLMETEK